MLMYLVHLAGDFCTAKALKTTEMCVILAKEPNDPALIEATEFVASVNKVKPEDVCVCQLGPGFSVTK